MGVKTCFVIGMLIYPHLPRRISSENTIKQVLKIKGPKKPWRLMCKDSHALFVQPTVLQPCYMELQLPNNSSIIHQTPSKKYKIQQNRKEVNSCVSIRLD